MPTSNDYLADLGVALELAALADVITTARFGAADLHVETKPDLTPVSDADRAVETAIRSRLAEVRPDDAVLGEEFGSSVGDGTAARRWVVDPIDGTKNFVRGVPVWATLIALLDRTADGTEATDTADGDRADAVVGVVSAPALGRRWWAYRGGGAWRGEPGLRPRPLKVSGVSRLEDASLSYSSLGGWAGDGRREAFLALTDKVWRTRAYGDFWSYLLVAEGAVDLAAEPELSLWDMAALAPIVTEAGGRFSGLNGRDGVHEGNAAASNGLLHNAFLAALKPSRPAKASPPAKKPVSSAKTSSAAGKPATSGRPSAQAPAKKAVPGGKKAAGGSKSGKKGSAGKKAPAKKSANARGTRRKGA